jgi:hypothetical protein
VRKYLLFLIALASIAFGVCVPVSAQVGGLGFPGPGPRVSSGGGAFVGLVDVYGSANTLAHYGNRAASAAQRGQKLWNVCDSATGLTCVDWSSSASTGLIVPTNVAGSPCSGTGCEIAIVYDDSGKNACTPTGSPCNLTQTHGTRPTVAMSSVNGLPSIACSGSQSMVGRSWLPPYRSHLQCLSWQSVRVTPPRSILHLLRIIRETLSGSTVHREGHLFLRGRSILLSLV